MSRMRTQAGRAFRAIGEGKLDAWRKTLTPSEAGVVESFNLLSCKPQLILANVGDDALASGGNELSRAVRERYPDALVICGKLEADLATLSADDAAAMLADFGLEQRAFDSGASSHRTPAPRPTPQASLRSDWRVDAPARLGAVLHRRPDRGALVAL